MPGPVSAQPPSPPNPAQLDNPARAGLTEPAQLDNPARAGLTEPAWSDVYEALDLCLGCKACKTECPSSVDMAKIKAEMQAQRYALEGTPLAARLFGHIHTVNRCPRPSPPWPTPPCAPTPPAPCWASWSTSTPSAPSPHRPPHLHRLVRCPPPIHPYHSQFTVNHSPVLLFPDTFTTYNYPQIGIAAVQLLEAAGFQVQLAQRVCCGRPMLSQGLVEDARRQAARNVELLYPLAEQGLPILICEPSCAAAFHEEYHDLLPGDPRVAVLAEQVFLIDDWLAQQIGGRPGPAAAKRCPSRSSSTATATRRPPWARPARWPRCGPRRASRPA
jgi:Fe-S oxidoreductase